MLVSEKVVVASSVRHIASWGVSARLGSVKGDGNFGYIDGDGEATDGLVGADSGGSATISAPGAG